MILPSIAPRFGSQTIALEQRLCYIFYHKRIRYKLQDDDFGCSIAPRRMTHTPFPPFLVKIIIRKAPNSLRTKHWFPCGQKIFKGMGFSASSDPR
jgi:hypothetical protein